MIKKSTAAWLILLAFLVGFALRFLPPRQQNQSTQGPQQNSQTPQQDPTNTPFPVEGRITVTRQQTSEEQTQAAYEEAREWAIIGITSVAAFFAFCAYRANKREAEAAEQQVEIMQSQFALSNRAYLEPIKWTGYWDIKTAAVLWGGMTTLEIKCRIKNFGKSPARVKSIDIDAPIGYQRTFDILINPRRYYVLTLHRPWNLNAEDVPPVPSTTPLVGRVTYHDGFRFQQRRFHLAFNREIGSDEPRPLVFRLVETGTNDEQTCDEHGKPD